MSQLASEADGFPVQRLSVTELQQAGAASARGLIPIYFEGTSTQLSESSAMQQLAAAEQTTQFGTQEVVNLAEDLLLVRTNFHAVRPAQRTRWELDLQGWLYLHFRLDGASEEETPDGLRSAHEGECFLVSASHRRPCSRQLRGDQWRSIGILCRPAFALSDLRFAEGQLPQSLQRMQAGDPEVDFWYAGALTSEMRAAAVALLQPPVHSDVRPIYLRAKVIEIVCLAFEQLTRASHAFEGSIKLSARDLRCLLEARRILTNASDMPSLGALARSVGLNRCKLALGFKQAFGFTVASYYRERRLELARDMLVQSAVPIAQVATLAGYADAGSFSKAFRARYGCLPSEMRSKARPLHRASEKR